METAAPRDGSIDFATQDKAQRARNYVQAAFQQISLDAQRTGGSSTRCSESSSSSSSARLSTFVDKGKVAAVLEAWTVLNPSVVYTQGLNEVTAMLLFRHRGDTSLAIDELQRLVEKGCLGGLWSAGMPLFEAGRKQLRPLLEAKVPRLFARIMGVGLDESAYLPQGWHSLFAKWLPQELAVAAVDDLLEHGMSALLAITLTVLAEVEDDIEQALAQPGAEEIEVLVGPEGCFTRLRELLERCGPALQGRWQTLQCSQELQEAAAASYKHASMAEQLQPRDVSGSFVQLVQQEAVLCLAASGSQRADERLETIVQCVNDAQQKATRDELQGDHSCLFKFAVMGDTQVGKSCLVHRSVIGSFENGGQPTLGVDFASKSVRVRGKQVKLQIWDLSGGTSFVTTAVTRSYLHDIAAIFLVYDICCRESFDSIGDWLQEIQKTAQNPNIVVILVGNKLDSAQHRKVEEAEARAFAAEHGDMPFAECSARRGDNVDVLFAKAAELVQRKMESADGKPLQGVRLSEALLRSRRGRLEDCRRACAVL